MRQRSQQISIVFFLLLFWILLLRQPTQGQVKENPAIAQATQLLAQGNQPQANAVLAKAYRKNSADKTLWLAYARSLVDKKEAEKILSRIAYDTTGTDSLRSVAFLRLGDAALNQGNFSEALSLFNNAFKLDSCSATRLAQGRALLWAGRQDSALTCLLPLLKTSDDALRPAAGFYMGRAFFQKRRYAEALRFLSDVFDADTLSAYKPFALMTMYECALQRNEHAQARHYRQKLLQSYPGIYCQMNAAYYDSLAMAHMLLPDSLDANGASTGATPAAAPVETLFTLQVGAFGSHDNAVKLQKQLSENLPKVTVSETIGNGVTLFRVWVGEFSSRQEATNFGQKRLQGRGLYFRVVVKELL